MGEATFPLDDEDPFLDVLWYETAGKMRNLTKQTMDQVERLEKSTCDMCFKLSKLFWCKLDQKK